MGQWGNEAMRQWANGMSQCFNASMQFQEFR